MVAELDGLRRGETFQIFSDCSKTELSKLSMRLVRFELLMFDVRILALGVLFLLDVLLQCTPVALELHHEPSNAKQRKLCKSNTNILCWFQNASFKVKQPGKPTKNKDFEEASIHKE